jgi:hypothetical protein
MMVYEMFVEAVSCEILARRLQGERVFRKEMHDDAFTQAHGTVAFHTLGEGATFEIEGDLAAMTGAGMGCHGNIP